MSRRRSSSNDESYDSSSSSVAEKKTKRKSSQSTTSGKRKHPSFKYMITEAIYIQRKHIKGSSRPAIRNYILENYDVDENRIKGYLSSNLSKMLEETEEGYPCLARVDMNYKLTPEWRKEWTKTYGIKPKTRKRKKRPANYPKHPRNAYLYYSTEVRPKRQDENPGKSFGDITKLVAAEWGNLSSKRKRKYVDLAKKDTRRYKKEMKEYEARKTSSSRSDSSSESEDRYKNRNRKRRATKSRSESEESTQRSKKKQAKPKRKNRSFTSSEESEEKGKIKADNDEKKTSTERTELKASSDKTKNK